MNLLYILLDCCRYDNFIDAKTPNFDKVGDTFKVYSGGCWTMPSIFNIIMGVPPIEYPKDILRPKKHEYLELHKEGRYKRFYTPNPFIKLYQDTLFKDWDRISYYHHKNRVEKIFKHIVEDTHSLEPDVEYDIFTLLMETHRDCETPIYERSDQIEDIEFIDEKFSYILDNIWRPVRIIISSDHGHLFGDKDENGLQLTGHSPHKGHVKFHKKLYEVPYIEGILK